MYANALYLLERFHRYVVTERRLSPHTSAAYRLDLASLVTFCEQEGLEGWDELAMEEQPLPGAVPMIVASRG